MVEFDVRMTSDSRCVILHDPAVDRTTDGSGKIWELDLSTVKSLDASHRHRESFSSVGIPTLQELLDTLPPTIELNIHVYPGPDDIGSIVEETCSQIRDRNRYNSAFISGSEEVMREVIATDSGVRRCLLDRADDPATYLVKCGDFSCYACQPSNTITTQSLCDEAHRLGFRVNPYYADEKSEMERLIACGVDGILTNTPERLIELLEG